MSSIEVVNQKLDSHIENQKEINNRIVDNLDRLSETVASVRVYEEALNNIREDVTDLKQVAQITSDRLGAVESQSDKNTELRKDQKQIKMVLIAAVISAAVTFGFSIVSDAPKVTLSEETIQKIKNS